MGREVVVAVTNGRLDFSTREQIMACSCVMGEHSQRLGGAISESTKAKENGCPSSQFPRIVAQCETEIGPFTHAIAT
jgi:hypothetical protein